ITLRNTPFLHDALPISGGLTNNKTIKNNKGPKINPTNCAVLYAFNFGSGSFCPFNASAEKNFNISLVLPLSFQSLSVSLFPFSFIYYYPLKLYSFTFYQILLLYNTIFIKLL